MICNESRKNGPREKWFSEKWSPRKMVPEKNDPQKNGPPGKMATGKMIPGKNGPRKIGPRETQKRKIVRWASSIVVCVCGMLACNQSMKTQNSTTNPKLGNKKSRGERRASWCGCGMFRCDQSMKTQNSKQQIFLDSFSVLQFGTYVES